MSEQTIWDLAREQQPTSWREAVVAMAETALEQSEGYRAPVEARDAVMALVRDRLGFDASSSVENACRLTLSTSIEAGALMGFALARTWSPNFEDIDGWYERARVFAGLV